MADFQSGVQQIVPAEMGSGVRPVDTTAASGIQAFGNIASAIGGTALNAYQGEQQVQQTQQHNTALASFSEQLLQVADAQQQGSIKADAALRKFRLLTAQMIANNPSMQNDIFKTYGNIVSQAGLGQNVAKAYQQQQDDQDAQHQAAILDAQKTGFVSPGMTDAQIANGVEQHQQYLMAANQAQAAKAQLDLINAKLSNQSQRLSIANANITAQRNALGLQRERAQQNFYEGAKSMTGVYFSKFHDDLDKAKAAVASGQMTKEQFINNVHSQLAVMAQTAQQLALQSGISGSVESLVKPMQDLGQSYIDNVSGKTTADVLSTSIANQRATAQQLLLASDPSFASVAAVSSMMPSGMSALQQGLGNIAINVLKRNNVLDENGNLIPPAERSKPADITNTNDPNHNLNIDQYATVVSGAIKSIRAGNTDPKLVGETSAHVSQMLQGLSTYGPTVTSPTELKSAIKFFASNDVGNFLKEHPDIVKGQAAVGATAVYRGEYENVVLPMVQEELLNHSVVTENPTTKNESVVPSTSKISMTFNGSGVTFAAKDMSPAVRGEVTRLNRELAPIITNLVRMRAHLSGSTDYKQYYSQVEQDLMPQSEEASE